MSNSISALVDRGWVQRTGAGGDRRQVVIEVTPTGRAALDRVSACAERHLAEVLAPLDARSRRLVHQGLGRLRQVFGGQSRPATGRSNGPRRVEPTAEVNRIYLSWMGGLIAIKSLDRMTMTEIDQFSSRTRSRR